MTEPWNKARVSESTFRAVWNYYDGATKRIAQHLHMHDNRVRQKAAELGLTRAGYLSPAQAAVILRVSPEQVRRYCRRGLLPAVRGFGAKKPFWLITRRAVEEFRAVVPALAVVPFTTEAGCVSVQDAAKMLSVHDATVRHLCADGTISARKSAYGYWQIPEAELERMRAEIGSHGHMLHRPTTREPMPEIKEMMVYPKDFPELLRFFVARSGQSVNSIATTADMDPAHLSRALRGQRDLSRVKINAVAAALRLRDVDHGRLLVAAGYCPRPFLVLGYDETFDAVAEAMATLDADGRESFGAEVTRLARRYRAPAPGAR